MTKKKTEKMTNNDLQNTMQKFEGRVSSSCSTSYIHASQQCVIDFH